MRPTISDNRRVAGIIGVLVVAFAFGAVTCSSSPGATSDLGVVRIALADVPADAHCLVLTVSGARTIISRFPLVPGQSASFEISGLPLGDDRFSGSAFDQGCDAGVSLEPTWLSDPIVATVVKGEVTDVTLVMHRNGRASVGVEFCDADLSSDPANCGACARACPTAPHSRPACINGACAITCDSPRADCNGDGADGCEVDLDTDAANCGGCANACPADQSCVAGACSEPVGVAAVAVGSFHACAIVDGGVRCWGRNVEGQLGANNCLCNTVSLVPRQAEGLYTRVTAVAAGGNHSCAVVDGSAVCWGANESGQLGTGTTVGGATPVQVKGLEAGVTAICAGWHHTCAVVGGGAQCWGLNDHGQLGNNSRVGSALPVPVEGLSSGVTKISCGGGESTTGEFTCALVNGGVRCWGSNVNGRLGDGSTVESIVPVQVQGLTSGVTAMAAGSTHGCAVVDGEVRCWGQTVWWDPGSPVAVPVPGLSSNSTAVSAGRFVTCALVAGAAKCWGSNSGNYLGDATGRDSSNPVQVLGLTSGVTAISVAGNGTHSCAAVNGAVQCWGINSEGELGDGTVITGGPVLVFGF